MQKIRVVWVCHLSNPTIRKKLKFARWSPLAIVRKLARKNQYTDFAQWNTNAIKEFEQFDDIELHIVAPYYGLTGVQHFELNGINYHFFQSEDDTLLSLIKSRIGKKVKREYKKNSQIILNLVEQIKPNIIHLIGAENPYYSESALSMPIDIPMIVSLQTLLCDPEFLTNYPIAEDEYDYRKNIEISILRRTDYVASTVEHFRKIIRQIVGHVHFLDMNLSLGEKVETFSHCDKQYDFVYFAANISKAVDYAIEAFARTKKKYKDITLHVIGGYDDSLMKSIVMQMDTLDITDGVDFTGKLKTYDDVMAEIRKARFALLPLKIDMISGTIRESMANGLPVVTTITPATPDLNQKRECVLLSEKGDFDAMAANMCRLINNSELVEKLKANGMQTVQEMFDNKVAMGQWRQNYHNIFNAR